MKDPDPLEKISLIPIHWIMYHRLRSAGYNITDPDQLNKKLQIQIPNIDTTFI